MSTPLNITIIATGNELLTGVTLDTHSRSLSQLATELGLGVSRHLTVGDDLPDLLWAFGEAAKISQLVFVVGGLGPTVDDLTQPALAQFCGRPLVRSEEALAQLTRLYAARSLTLHDNNTKQADFPEGSEILPNPIGTAAGFSVVSEGVRFVCLPGVPREFHRMVAEQVKPRLPVWFPTVSPMQRVVLRTFGATESGLDRRIAEIGDFPPEVKVGFRHSFPENDVVLLAAPNRAQELEQAKTLVKEKLGPLVYSEGPSIAETVIALLKEKNLTLLVAESCTGGLLGAGLTAVAGASEVFDGGAITYHNGAKRQFLGVPQELLQNHGAVSEATVLAMATGVRRERAKGSLPLEKSVSLAITGIAGPGGGTEEKPVGTVWIGLSGPWGEAARCYQFRGDREQNRQLSVRSALELLRRQLLGLVLDIKERQ